MKIFKKIGIVASALLLGAMHFPLTAFAANEYNINYSGGADLGSGNVTVNAGLINGLTELISVGSVTVTPNDASVWKSGYIKENNGTECNTFKYLEIKSAGLTGNSNYGFTMSNNSYDLEVILKKVVAESIGSNTVVIGYRPDVSLIYGGFAVYSNKVNGECQNLKSGLSTISVRNDNANDKLFIELVLKLHKKGETAILNSNELYFGITDIDAAQSYKIMNSSNLLSPSNMFAKDAAALQPTASLKNKFVASGNYIYSQYKDNGDPAIVDSNNAANVYVKIEETAQNEGLDVVYGFAHAAGSGIVFLAKQYTVKYVAETGGSITGKTSETVPSGSNPTSTTKQANDKYKFVRWIANKNVTLKNGDTITAGNLITEAQIKQVVVNEDLTFTAQFVRQYTVNYEAEEGGRITGQTTEQVDAGSNPTSTTKQANDKYKFVRWIANKNVTLKNGDTITAGNLITEAQIKQVVVNEDLTFTAQFTKIQYKVDYEAEEGGKITGIETENVDPEDNPSATETESEENYEFDHWIADIDVALEDGTEIKAGEPLTEEQIKKVVVDQNIKFTAIFKKKAPATPDTGVFTKVGGVIASSALGVVVIALIIRLLPRLNHKKVKFD